VGLCYLDAELRFVLVNDFLAAINGRPAKEHIGKSIKDVLPEIAAAGVEEELRAVLESGEPVVKGTVTARTPAHPDEDRTYLHYYHAIRSDDGKIIGVGCCVMDITERKHAEQERDEKMRELEKFNAMAVDRELKMIELKREINELCKQCGIAPRYDISFAGDTESTPKKS